MCEGMLIKNSSTLLEDLCESSDFNIRVSAGCTDHWQLSITSFAEEFSADFIDGSHVAGPMEMSQLYRLMGVGASVEPEALMMFV
mmetsp:Transcript_35048/g.65428  ORF Transcript_35048/g.65428 Transcript_35048/m.65428 type:complete len:85 (+) Transcript_35048:1575-1829(+)